MDRPHSGLMLADRITLPHFSVSSAMNFPNSADVLANSPPPRSASCALILGSEEPALISLFSLSMISAGVLLGAPMPYQLVDCSPGRIRPQSALPAARLSGSRWLPPAHATCPS